MGKIYKNGIIYGGGGETGSAEFENLTYADYKAGNYDVNKDYIITDYPYSNVNAKQINFDDTTAQLGVSDVQGAINKNTENINEINESILSTVSECSASTTPTDIAGASAVAELNDRLTNILPSPASACIEVTFDVNGHASLYLPDFISRPILFVYDVHGIGNLADINFAVTNGGRTTYGLYLMSPNAVGVFTVEIIYQPL